MSSFRNDGDQERLIDYVRQALARIDAGEAVQPTQLCAAHPHLARPLAEVLGLADELPQLQQAALREDPLAGVVLAARYRLMSCLGRGAMGVVYRGEDQELKREVAVKILDARLFRDPEAERRFQREGEALAALQHPNVVAVFDRGRTPEGIHFLVMELLEGTTLAGLLDGVAAGQDPASACRERLGDGAFESHWPRQCAAWGRDLAAGLAVAHAHQLVHRDVKPSNVFLTRGGRPVLLDFGIAARGDDQRLTATHSTLGTPWYMAPEQVRAGGLGTAEPTLDVYGLGASLYHMLAGRPPYEGDAAAVLAALPTRDPEPLLRLRPDLPRDLVAIVEHCMEREPAHRYAQASALAADLTAFLAHRPVTARPLSAFGRRVRAWRRAPAWPVAFVAAFVAAVALALFVWSDGERRERARLQEKVALEATLPSLLAIEGYPEHRVLQVLAKEHAVGVDLLDRMLAVDPDDLAALLMRACLHLDLGAGEKAAADMRRLATGSAYLSQVAERHAAATPDERGVRVVDLAGLPEPVTPQECFVAGFHELRRSDVAGFAARADALLRRAGEHYLPARYQRLFALASLAETSPPAEQPQLLKLLYDETVALEALHGGPTARTCAMRGAALLLQRRYAECVPEFELSLRLRPDRHGPHHNLGIALRRLTRLDDSERHLRHALELRPFAWNTQFTLAQLLRDRGAFDAARTVAGSLSRAGTRGEAWKVPDLLGSIAVAEVLARLNAAVVVQALPGAAPVLGELRATAKALATQAVAAYDEALAVRKSATARQRRDLAVALQADDRGAAIAPFLQGMGDEPGDPYQLANAAYLLPAGGLDAAQTKAVANLLRRLAKQLAPNDPAFRARMDAEMK